MLHIDDVWFCAEGNRGGRPVIVRGRQNLREIVGIESHPKILRIVWAYEVQQESGLPSPHLSEKMGGFEDIIFNALEEDLLCIFFSVYLHNGVKKWAAYTSDVQATCDKFNAALASHQPYPVNLTVEDDPLWHEYRNLMTDTGMWATAPKPD